MGRKRKQSEGQTPDEMAQQQETYDDYVEKRLAEVMVRLDKLEAAIEDLKPQRGPVTILCGACHRTMKPGEDLHHVDGSKIGRCSACMKCFACGRPLVDNSHHLRTDAIPLASNGDGLPHCRDCAQRLGL